MNRTFRIGPKTLVHRVSPGLFSSLRNQCFRVLRDATQLWYNFHNSHSILVVAFSSSVGIVAFLWLFVWLFVNLMLREQTLIPGFASRFCFVRIDTREDANIHKAIACKYLLNNICTVVEEWHHGYFCLGYFSSPTHFDLVTRMARKVWRHCGLVFGHDRYSHAGNCIGLLSNTGLFLSTGGRYLVLLQRHSTRSHCSCLCSSVSGVKTSQSKFLIYTPLHHCLQFLTIGHRYLLMNLHVVQFQCGFELRGLTYSSICTDFPRDHPVGSWS